MSTLVMNSNRATCHIEVWPLRYDVTNCTSTFFTQADVLGCFAIQTVASNRVQKAKDYSLVRYNGEHTLRTSERTRQIDHLVLFDIQVTFICSDDGTLPQQDYFNLGIGARHSYTRSMRAAIASLQYVDNLGLANSIMSFCKLSWTNRKQIIIRMYAATHNRFTQSHKAQKYRDSSSTTSNEQKRPPT